MFEGEAFNRCCETHKHKFLQKVNHPWVIDQIKLNMSLSGCQVKHKPPLYITFDLSCSITTVCCNAFFLKKKKSEDQEEQTSNCVRQNLANGSCQPSCPKTGGHLQRIISIEEDHLPHLLQNNCQAQTPLQECSEGEEASDNEENIDLVMSDIYPCASSPQQQQSTTNTEKRETPTSPRGQPVGKETSLNVSMCSH